MIFFFSIFGVGRILRPDQEHKEVISAPEGRPAGSRAGSSSLPADGSAEERRGFLRGRGETPETSGQTLRSGTRPSRIRSRCEKFQTFLTDVIFFFFPSPPNPEGVYESVSHEQTRTRSNPEFCLSLSLSLSRYPAAQLNYSPGKPTHCSFPPRFQDPPQFTADGAKNSTSSSTPFCASIQNDPVCSALYLFFLLFFLFLFAPLSECHKLELLAKAPSHRRIVGNNCPRCECATLFSPLTSAGKRF